MRTKRNYDVVTAGDLIKNLSVWVVDILLVVALALTLSYLFGTRVRMEGSSMTPTLSNGDRMLINRTKGKLLTIHRFDILAYELPEQEGVFLKRVLALPGETLQIREGKVYINGEELPASEYTDSLAFAGTAQTPLTMMDNEYFVIGENADASLDSRFADVGNINASQILGTVWIRFSPFRDLRFLP